MYTKIILIHITCEMHELVPFGLWRMASKEQLVDPSVKLKQHHSVAALQTLIHLLGVPSSAGMTLLDSLLACWMTIPEDHKHKNYCTVTE